MRPETSNEMSDLIAVFFFHSDGKGSNSYYSIGSDTDGVGTCHADAATRVAPSRGNLDG